MTSYFSPQFYDGSYSEQWNAVRGHQSPIATGYPRGPMPMLASSVPRPREHFHAHYESQYPSARAQVAIIRFDEAVPKPKTPQNNPTGYRSRKEKARANKEEHKRRAKRGK